MPAFVSALPLGARTARRARAHAPTCSAGSPPPVTPRVEAYLARAGGAPLAGLARADAAYAALVGRAPGAAPPGPPPLAVREGAAGRAPPAADVAVAGGTLGLVLARALQAAGLRVVVVERGRAVGREQEWNVSRVELQALVRLGVLGEERVEAAIVSEWPAGRIAFGAGEGREVLDAGPVLNVGVSPARLLASVREEFEKDGGVVLEQRAIQGMDVYDDQVVLRTAATAGGGGGDGAGGAGGSAAAPDAAGDGGDVCARLLVDCMGSFSPLAAQARGYARPDGVCVTVGSCAQGPFTDGGADVLAAVGGVSGAYGQQSFWEAFPAAGGGRTTYMFQYGACDAERPSVSETLDEYLGALRGYQGVSPEELQPLRVLFGFFPAHRASPLRTPYPRVFFAGDAGGTQSPVSFGGFAALLRHLPRLCSALPQALAADTLAAQDLAAAAPYMPGQAASWLFARTMSAPPGAAPAVGADGLVRAVQSNMRALAKRPEDQRAFLQDAVLAGALAKALVTMVGEAPVLAVRLVPHLGVPELTRFLGHFVALGAYSVGDRVCEGLGVDGAREDLPVGVRRGAEALRWGSGRDHIGE